MEQLVLSRLARAGNWAVVQLPNCAFPGIHVQGDSFVALVTQVAEVARTLSESTGGTDAVDELDHAVQEMHTMVDLYERKVDEHSIPRPPLIGAVAHVDIAAGAHDAHSSPTRLR